MRSDTITERLVLHETGANDTLAVRVERLASSVREYVVMQDARLSGMGFASMTFTHASTGYPERTMEVEVNDRAEVLITWPAQPDRPRMVIDAVTDPYWRQRLARTLLTAAPAPEQ